MSGGSPLRRGHKRGRFGRHGNASLREQKVRQVAEDVFKSAAVGAARGHFTSARLGRRRKVSTAAALLSKQMVHPRTIIDEQTLSLNWRPTDGLPISVSKASFWAYQTLSPDMFDVAIRTPLNVANTNAGLGGITGPVKVQIENPKTVIRMKNNFQQKADITVWECFPRNDIPLWTYDSAGVQQTTHSVLGKEPAMLTQGWLEADNATMTNIGSAQNNATNLPGWNDQSPFQASSWCSIFKIKKHGRRTLNPGEEWIITHHAKSQSISKEAMALLTGQLACANTYSIMRRGGSVLLVRVQGTTIHDESKSAPPLVDSNLNAVPGMYNIDITFRRTFDLWWLASTNSRKIAYINRWNSITIAPENAVQWAEVQPGEEKGEA